MRVAKCDHICMRRPRPKLCQLVALRQLKFGGSFRQRRGIHSVRLPPQAGLLRVRSPFCPRDRNWWVERAATSHVAPRLVRGTLRGRSAAKARDAPSSVASLATPCSIPLPGGQEAAKLAMHAELLYGHLSSPAGAVHAEQTSASGKRLDADPK